MPGSKRRLLALGGVLALMILAVAVLVIIPRSEAILNARHELPTMSVRAATTAPAIALGAHLTTVTACATCHGEGLTGSMQTVAGSPVYAPNLTVVAKRRSDAQLESAIRAGLRANGTSELAMPATVYGAFSDDELAAIMGYLRSLPASGTALNQPSPNILLRAYLVAGLYRTELQRMAQARPALDAGPRFAAGRHLAMIACGQCHGADLRGGHGAPGPDLTVRGYYSRGQFHILMRTGEGVEDMHMDLMAHTAVMSFRHFDDAEIDAIYDYLDARDRILAIAAGKR
jgi:mono/diheme cytochrome c family protein